MEQTIEAIEQIKTLYIEGTVVWPFSAKPTMVPFRFWVQVPTENSPLKMRGEVQNHIMVAKGDVVYECWPDAKTAQVYYGPGIPDLKYWYKAAELAPWVVREMPKMIQQYAEGWQQSVDRDPATGQERILATCTYPPSNMSFLLVVDPESKLSKEPSFGATCNMKASRTSTRRSSPTTRSLRTSCLKSRRT